MNKKYHIELTTEERQHLEKIITSGISPARQITRARILLKSDCSESGPNWEYEEICKALDVNPTTVATVRKAYMEGGIGKAIQRKKVDRTNRRRLDGNAEARLIALTCSEAPEGYERWSLRLLQDRFIKLEIVDTISYETIRTTLKKTNLSLG